MKLNRSIALVAFLVAGVSAFAQTGTEIVSGSSGQPILGVTARTTTQGMNFADLLKGGGFAAVMKPSDLPADFVAAKISTDGAAGGGGGLMDMIMSPMVMMMGALGGGMGGDDKMGPMMAVMGAMELSWSSGQTTTVNGQTFLVTYKATMDMASMAGMEKKDDLSDTVLRLNLVRLDAIKTLTPRPDVTKADFVKLLSTKMPKKPAAKPSST